MSRHCKKGHRMVFIRQFGQSAGEWVCLDCKDGPAQICPLDGSVALPEVAGLGEVRYRCSACGHVFEVEKA